MNKFDYEDIMIPQDLELHSNILGDFSVPNIPFPSDLADESIEKRKCRNNCMKHDAPSAKYTCMVGCEGVSYVLVRDTTAVENNPSGRPKTFKLQKGEKIKGAKARKGFGTVVYFYKNGMKYFVQASAVNIYEYKSPRVKAPSVMTGSLGKYKDKEYVFITDFTSKSTTPNQGMVGVREWITKLERGFQKGQVVKGVYHEDNSGNGQIKVKNPTSGVNWIPMDVVKLKSDITALDGVIIQETGMSTTTKVLIGLVGLTALVIVLKVTKVI